MLLEVLSSSFPLLFKGLHNDQQNHKILKLVNSHSKLKLKIYLFWPLNLFVYRLLKFFGVDKFWDGRPIVQ